MTDSANQTERSFTSEIFKIQHHPTSIDKVQICYVFTFSFKLIFSVHVEVFFCLNFESKQIDWELDDLSGMNPLLNIAIYRYNRFFLNR